MNGIDAPNDVTQDATGGVVTFATNCAECAAYDGTNTFLFQQFGPVFCVKSCLK